jgi:transposase-like protein
MLLILIQSVSPGSTIYTDGLKSFKGLRGFKHISRTQPFRNFANERKSAVLLADRAVGNLQQWLIVPITA